MCAAHRIAPPNTVRILRYRLRAGASEREPRIRIHIVSIKTYIIIIGAAGKVFFVLKLAGHELNHIGADCRQMPQHIGSIRIRIYERETRRFADSHLTKRITCLLHSVSSEIALALFGLWALRCAMWPEL